MNFMGFIINSKKSKKEVVEILQENTSHFKSNRNNNCKEIFNGEIFENSFKIKRNKKYIGIVSTMLGNIEDHNTGSKITVKMQLHPIVKGFVIVWFALMISLLIKDLYTYISSGISMDEETIFSIILGLIVYILLRIDDARKAKKRIEDLLR